MPKSRYYLLYLDRRLELKEKQEYSVGRNKDNTIFLPHISVSRFHSVIAWRDNQFIIEDRKSTNGTIVNKHKVGESTLNDGDSIQLGVYSLQFKVVDEKHAAEPVGLSPTMELECELARIIRDNQDEKLINRLLGVKMIIAKKEERLLALAYRDALTGLYNRRHFDHAFLSEYTRANRYGRSLSLLFIDIDHFKRVNDEYGHVMGDKVLRAVAEIISSSIRQNDTAARFGGEEICVLLPETDLQAAINTAEKIRRKIEKESGALTHVPVTASIGVSSLKPSHDVKEKLLQAGDKALYKAKNSGRNRVAAMI